MPEGYAAYLLDRDVDALRSVYAECGVDALLDDEKTIQSAFDTLLMLLNAIETRKTGGAHHAA